MQEAELKAKQEAELKIKAEAEAKAAAELKAKQEAESKAADELGGIWPLRNHRGMTSTRSAAPIITVPTRPGKAHAPSPAPAL